MDLFLGSNLSYILKLERLVPQDDALDQADSEQGREQRTAPVANKWKGQARGGHQV